MRIYVNHKLKEVEGVGGIHKGGDEHDAIRLSFWTKTKNQNQRM